MADISLTAISDAATAVEPAKHQVCFLWRPFTMFNQLKYVIKLVFYNPWLSFGGILIQEKISLY